MIRHYIVIASSYSKSTRVALDYLLDSDTRGIIKDDLARIKSECGKDARISAQSILTESKSWDSVAKSDPFFKGIELLDSVEEFIECVNQNQNLTGLDVAKYILSQTPGCTHLKLEKMVYLCFAEYLCMTKKLLFENKIYAFDYGPVVKDVYDKFKCYKDRVLSDDYLQAEMSYKSRILNSENGLEKIGAINKIIQWYRNMSADVLVDITHRKNSPWEKMYDGTLYKEIPAEVILNYHCNECIS